MQSRDKPTAAIQENLLALLLWNDDHGRAIAAMVDPALFEGDYRILAERGITYWQQHRKAPRLHAADLMADVLEDKANRRANTYRHILSDLMELSKHINTAYVLDQLRKFTRLQKMKAVLLQSIERINNQQELAIEEIETLWQELLHSREISFSPGVRLNEYHGLLNRINLQNTEFDTGIKQLDDRFVVPARDQVMLLLGGAGRGKSWFLTHIGRRALMRGMKVVHITLELTEDQVQQRYYQGLFSIRKRSHDDPVEVRTLLRSNQGRLTDFGTEEVNPGFAMNSKEIRLEMDARIDQVPSMSARLRDVIVKGFPMRSITTNEIAMYLDELETTERFIPDMVLLDYIGVLKTDQKNHRISLGREFENFRGLCGERHVAGITAHQISKLGVMKGETHSVHVAEDWSMVGTADIILAYSCTDDEFKHGLARLYVAKARDESDKFGVLLTQNYTIGQFVLDSMPLPYQDYEHLMKKFATPKADDDRYDEDEDAA
jgi:hypothetical protein